MPFDRDRHSIINSSQSQTSSVNPSNPNHPYTKPLINSAVASNSDEEIARQQQERLYLENSMDVDEPSVAATASYDARRLEEIEADAAIARQLQEEEYSRKSIVPSRPYQRGSRNEKSPPIAVDSYGEPIFSDAELAAQLQAEENKKQQKPRHRLAISAQRGITHPTTNQTDEPEVIPFPSAARPTHQRPSHSANNNLNNTDVSSLFRIFPSRGRAFPGSRRSGDQRIRDIQNNNEDFGPDDYENLIALDNSDGNKPLTRDQINRLPTEKFRRPATKNDEDNKCNICWDQFEQNQTLRRLPCLHVYHKDCIDPWLKKNNVCPICRMPPIQ